VARSLARACGARHETFSLKVISPGLGLYKRHVDMTRTRRERVASE